MVAMGNRPGATGAWSIQFRRAEVEPAILLKRLMKALRVLVGNFLVFFIPLSEEILHASKLLGAFVAERAFFRGCKRFDAHGLPLAERYLGIRDHDAVFDVPEIRRRR